MRLNIFRINSYQVDELQRKLESVGMSILAKDKQYGWKSKFYFANEPNPSDIPWTHDYWKYFEEIGLPRNINYFAVHLFTKGEDVFAISYGKSHFYLRQYCDFDFGIEIAKRIADKNDIKQTASKRFQGKKKKDIKSYAPNTPLIIESGESLDFLQGSILEEKRDHFGKSAKFGTSVQLNLDTVLAELGVLMSRLLDELATPPNFKIPRTQIITEENEIQRLNTKLTTELRHSPGTTDFAQNSFDLYGVDFVFSGQGTYKFWCPGYSRDLLTENLSIGEFKRFINAAHVSDSDILNTRVSFREEGRLRHAKLFLETIDYIVEDENVLLSSGKWTRFNQDYLDFLNEYISDITIEQTEDELKLITIDEGDFNNYTQSYGYTLADKDFSILRTKSATPIEAWDLSRNQTVYAVKFGTAQKLGYVCDQSMATLEILRTRANVRQVPHFDKYCLWLGYRGKTLLGSIAESGSIILKQKIELWARRCMELGIEPVIKISRVEKQQFLQEETA